MLVVETIGPIRLEHAVKGNKASVRVWGDDKVPRRSLTRRKPVPQALVRVDRDSRVRNREDFFCRRRMPRTRANAAAACTFHR